MDPDVSGSMMDFEMEHHGGGGAVVDNEIRMRDADLNVHYASPVTEVLTIPRGLAPPGIRPLPILKEAAHLEGFYGSPYVAKVPSPWTPYQDGTAEAYSENHAPFLDPSGEASRRRQEFLARQQSPMDPNTYRTQRLPYEWEIAAGADRHTPISMPMPLSTQIRLVEAESQRLRREAEQARVGITLPASSNASLRLGMKRPSPVVEEEEAEQTRGGASDQEPPRRITGTVATFFNYVPRFLSVVFAYFWPHQQGIVAVETTRNGRKRRAVAGENMSDASVVSSPDPLHVPGHWPESTPLNFALMRCSVKKLAGAGTTDVPPTSRLDSVDDARAPATTMTPSQGLVTSGLTYDPHAHGYASASETLNANIDPASTTGTAGKNLKNQTSDQIATTVHAQNYDTDASHRQPNQTQDDASSSHAPLSSMNVHQKDTEQLAKERYLAAQNEDRMAQERVELALRNSQHRSRPPQYGTLWRHLAAARRTSMPDDVRRDSAYTKLDADRDAEVNALVDKAKKVTIEVEEHKNLSKVRADEQRKARDAAAKEKANKDAKKAADLAKKAKEKAKQKAERAERERRRKAEEREKKAEEESFERELDALVPGDVDKGKLIRPLDPKWVHKLQVAMSTRNEDEVLATSVAGVPLTRRDLAKLLPSAAWTAGSLPPGGGAPWLNDESVNAWLATIVTSKLEQAGWKRGNGAPPYVAFNSAWFTNYQKKGIAGIANWARRQKISGVSMLDADRIFFPVNTGSHWILLIIHPKEKKLEVLDSMHGRPTRFFRVLREWLNMELGDHYNRDEWNESDVQSGAQLNSDDCGVFVCVNALASAKNKPFSDIEPTDGMFDARRMIGAILLNGGFHNDWQL